jgi:branched-chain amino acid transport system substrate-binding protein
MGNITRRSVLAGSAGLLAAPAIIGQAVAATRGVSDTEIVIGMMTDLSGVTAVQGTNATNAMHMIFDDLNEKGGINGRKVRLIAEDMEYMVPKAVQAMNKLVNRDNIFLSLFSGGTPQMDAVLPMMLEKGVRACSRPPARDRCTRRSTSSNTVSSRPTMTSSAPA